MRLSLRLESLKHGTEEITRDIQNIREDELSHLDETLEIIRLEQHHG